MAVTIGGRLKHAWNSFRNADEERPIRSSIGGPTSSTRPDRPRFSIGNGRTIIASIYTRVAVDASQVRMEHVRLNSEGLYEDTIRSGLNECLTVRANIDQAGGFLRRDMVLTLLQHGTMAVVPVETTINPKVTGSWDVNDIRVGTVIDWAPEDVTVRCYDQRIGEQRDITVPKSMVAIVENPFFSVMNEPNSTLQRLVHKLSLLDHVDKISSQGKLDLIIQLPYETHAPARKAQAQERREEVEHQLSNSTYGIAYAAANEKITQLNRSVENNLLEQVKWLQDQLYAELGMTADIMNGTADDTIMLNYMNRIIEPILDAIVEAMIMVFLTKTARTQGQSIMYFQTPFKMIPISQLADVVDVLSRNQIVTPNEVRPALGLKPSKAPQANQLVNSNMPLDDQVTGPEATSDLEPDEVADEENLDRQMASLGIK